MFNEHEQKQRIFGVIDGIFICIISDQIITLIKHIFVNWSLFKPVRRFLLLLFQLQVLT